MALVTEDRQNDRAKLIEVNQRGFSRLQSLASEVERTVLIWEPEIIVIEAYAFHRNIDSFIRLVEVGTAIKERLYSHNFSWVEVTPTTLKKWTTGRGNADKEQMGIVVEHRWNFKGSNSDAVDAYALAQMGLLGVPALSKLTGVKTTIT